MIHLQQGCYGTAGVPQHGCKVRDRLPLLAELQEGILPRLWAGQLVDPLVDLLSVHLSQSCGHSLVTKQQVEHKRSWPYSETVSIAWLN